MPVIVVTGATGSQGNSVVRSVLAELGEEWTVRAVTRDASTDRAKAVAALSPRVTLVEADQVAAVTDDSKLVSAFAGAQAAFLLTNFWDPAQMDKEYAVGVAQVQAAKKAGVEHVIWSTLPNVRAITAGKFHVPHFSDKGAIDEVVLKSGFARVTFVVPAFYFQNLFTLMAPQEAANADGTKTRTWTLPDMPIVAYDVGQTGVPVVAALKDPENLGKGTYLPCWGEQIKSTEIANHVNKLAPAGVTYAVNTMTTDDFKKLPIPAAEELADMFAWFIEYGYMGPYRAHAAVTGLSTFDEWLAKQKLD